MPGKRRRAAVSGAAAAIGSDFMQIYLCNAQEDLDSLFVFPTIGIVAAHHPILQGRRSEPATLRLGLADERPLFVMALTSGRPNFA
ncbi:MULTISPECIES: hypothetical protein [Cupriavidus]